MEPIENKKIKDIMTYGVISIPEDVSVIKLIELFAVGNIHGVVVMDKNNQPVGFVSDIDILKAFGRDFKEVKVKEIMSTPLLKINQDKKVKDAAEIMKSKNCHRIAVVDDNGTVRGIFSITDVVREIYKATVKL